MPRPRIKKIITLSPEVTFYKPRGVPLSSLEIVDIRLEEWEVLRLRHLKNLDQTAIAKEMNTSQSTVQRILSSAHKKIGDAIVEGRAIRIQKEEV